MSALPRGAGGLPCLPPAAGYGVALLATALALAARFALTPLLPPIGFPFLTFFPAVLATALLGGLGPALVATALSTAAAAWFFIPPVGSFGPMTPGDTIALVFFVAVLLVDCLVIHLMTRSLRRLRAERTRGAALARELSARVAELRLREAELAARESELAGVLEATGAGVFALDPGWRITFMNGRAREQLAGGRDLTGEVLWDAFPDAVGGPFAEAYGRTMRDRVRARTESVYAPLGRRYAAESHPRADGGIVVFYRDVTEERSAADRLAETLSRLRLAQEASGVGMFECDLTSGRNTWSDTMFRLYGLPPDAPAPGMEPGGAHLDLVHPEDRARLAETRAALAADPVRTTFELEFRIRRADTGEVRWIAARGEFVRDPAGRPLLVRGGHRDLTARRTAEAALAASEARLRTIVETVPVGLVMAEFPSGRIVGGNGYVETLLRHPILASPDVHGYGEWVSFHADGRRVDSTEYPLARMLLAGEENPSIEVHYQRGDGSRAWTRIIGRPVRDGAGRLVGGVVALVDVDAERRAREALAEGEDRLRLALEAGAMGIWDWDLAVDRLTWDTRQCELFGLDPAEGAPSVEAAFGRVHPDDRAGLDAAIAAALAAGGRGFTHEFRVRLPAGVTRWIGAHGHVVRDPQGRPLRLVGLDFDITPRREAEAVLARSRAELERLVEERTAALRETEGRLAHAAKMEALGRLAGGVAHDFNNVLQAVQGGISLARRRLRGDPQAAARFLDLAADATSRGAAVTGRLLAFARRGDLSAAPVEPAALLDGLAQMLRHTLGPAVALTVEAAPGTPPLLADAGQLEAVLVNLVNNARDALPGGAGRIALRAAPARPRPGGPVAAARLEPGDYVRLLVVDDGAGMTEEVLSRVTEPFFTTKPKGAGTGLGLAMARGFAEQSRGALTIESVPGRGTTIALWLPRAPAAAADGQAEAAAAPPPSARPAAVLLVDDEPGVRTVIATGLADRGHAVTEAADAPAALARLDAGLVADVLVTDLAMPGGMDGLDLVREARRRLPGLPALLITGHPGEAGHGALRAAAAGGAVALIRKPASAEAVEAQVAALLGVAG